MRDKIIYILLFVFLLSSCKHEDLDIYEESENYSNAADFLANNYSLSLFHAALKQANLLDLLKQEGPYTLFAPDNNAFNALGIVRASDFSSMNQDSLRAMLLYHILPRRLYNRDIPNYTIDNKYMNMVDKEVFIGYRFSNSCTSCNVLSEIYVNGSKSVYATQNIALANGVLHVIDKVLKYDKTLQDVLTHRPEYSYFVALLKRVGDWERLAQPRFTTVFAPDNQAFEKAGFTLEQINKLDPKEYQKRLWRVYWVDNHIFLSDMVIYGQLDGSGYYGAPFYKVPIIGDEDYYFGISAATPKEPFIIEKNPKFMDSPIRKSNFQPDYRTDYKADNGVLHGITSLLVLPAEAKIK